MLTLKISEKEYKVKFGYNSFCDSTLMEDTEALISLLAATTGKDGTFGQLAAKMFKTTRSLLFEGFKKYNPVKSVEEVGDLLDTYLDEKPDGEDRGIVELFGKITEELTTEGFFAGLMETTAKNLQKMKKKN